MANAYLAWYERPDYLAYTDWTPIPGITSYVGPRNGTGTDVTQFHPGQARLSEENLPDIMYELYPCAEWRHFKNLRLPGPKSNPDGSGVYEQYTRPGRKRQRLLDFKVLPDKISTEEGWWYFEFVRRLDPRIRQHDILMRFEVCEERLRLTDQQYINRHLNMPGSRLYRKAWKMISWHAKTGDNNENQVEQWVLDRLTDGQKRANTTRGSTPGLIDPVLPGTPQNRVRVPALVTTKRGPECAMMDVNDAVGPQPLQPAPGSQAQQFTEAAQITQAVGLYHSSPFPHVDQNEQPSQNSQAGSSDVASALSPLAMSTSSRKSVNEKARLKQNDLRRHTITKARDAPAVPQPPPFNSGMDQYHRPEVCQSHLEPLFVSPYSTNQPPDFENNQVEPKAGEFRTTNRHMPGSDYPSMSDEYIAELVAGFVEVSKMAANSDEAMAEIEWMCEPFLDPASVPQGPPPMDLRAGLITDLGIGSTSPIQAERGSKDVMPNPERTMQISSVAQGPTPLLSEKHESKSKACDDGNESFQHVQLDVERQEHRPVKRVKSVHEANIGAHYHDAYSFQNQSHFAPQPGACQSPP